MKYTFEYRYETRACIFSISYLKAFIPEIPFLLLVVLLLYLKYGTSLNQYGWIMLLGIIGALGYFVFFALFLYVGYSCYVKVEFGEIKIRSGWLFKDARSNKRSINPIYSYGDIDYCYVSSLKQLCESECCSPDSIYTVLPWLQYTQPLAVLLLNNGKRIVLPVADKWAFADHVNNELIRYAEMNW